jgi:hypothetical protein
MPPVHVEEAIDPQTTLRAASPSINSSSKRKVNPNFTSEATELPIGERGTI